VQNLDDESRRQVVDDHIDTALSEVFGGQRWLSRTDLANEVQLRISRDIGPGFPVRDRIDEILDTFMSRDDSA
jgi:hypothetical protein